MSSRWALSHGIASSLSARNQKPMGICASPAAPPHQCADVPNTRRKMHVDASKFTTTATTTTTSDNNAKSLTKLLVALNELPRK